MSVPMFSQVLRFMIINIVSVDITFIYYQVPSFEIQADILRVLKVFDEPLGESNTERRVKISAGISKEGT